MSGGLLDSARSMLGGLLGLARTRLELFGTELQEELLRLATALLGGFVVLVLAALGLAFAALALVLAAGEEQRLPARRLRDVPRSRGRRRMEPASPRAREAACLRGEPRRARA